MKKILIPAIIATLIISGCTSTSEVLKIGKDTYTVSSTVRGFHSHADAKEMTLKRATEYCASMSKEIAVTNTASSGAAGWTPLGSDVIFRCLDSKDSDYQRPNFQSEPTTKIQIEKK